MTVLLEVPLDAEPGLGDGGAVRPVLLNQDPLGGDNVDTLRSVHNVVDIIVAEVVQFLELGGHALRFCMAGPGDVDHKGDLWAELLLCREEDLGVIVGVAEVLAGALLGDKDALWLLCLQVSNKSHLSHFPAQLQIVLLLGGEVSDPPAQVSGTDQDHVVPLVVHHDHSGSELVHILIERVWPFVQQSGQTSDIGPDNVVLLLDVLFHMERGEFLLAEIAHDRLTEIRNLIRVFGGSCWAVTLISGDFLLLLAVWLLWLLGGLTLISTLSFITMKWVGISEGTVIRYNWTYLSVGVRLSCAGPGSKSPCRGGAQPDLGGVHSAGGGWLGERDEVLGGALLHVRFVE